MKAGGAGEGAAMNQDDCREVADAQRGAGCFDRTMASLRRAQARA